jgi:hypothetical protein
MFKCCRDIRKWIWYFCSNSPIIKRGLECQPEFSTMGIIRTHVEILCLPILRYLQRNLIVPRFRLILPLSRGFGGRSSHFDSVDLLLSYEYAFSRHVRLNCCCVFGLKCIIPIRFGLDLTV